jgi:bifunctional UDP-N-acetylglucosamine pyrophosphorylase / glucosamine-1-phosphate N-acetyltransferase
MRDRTGLVIVLAAGEGTRMRSRRPKVLHAVAGRSLLGHVLATVNASGRLAVAVVIPPDADAVAAEALEHMPEAEIFVQKERRGTAHAVLAARTAIQRGSDDILIVFGDTPLIQPSSLHRLRAALTEGAAIAVLGFRAADPTGYGRLICDGGRLVAVREERDASAPQRAINLCNAGPMAIAGAAALSILERIDDCNSKREFYLTDAVAIAHSMGLGTVALETREEEVQGINTMTQLADAEAAVQRGLRAAALERGVSMPAPDTVFLCTDTVLGRDVVIEPYVVLGPGVILEDDVVVRSFSYLEGAHVEKGAMVGPFARLRPGAQLGPRVKIGNFVEVKASTIEAGAKANHLAYIGDARVGEGANLGAGTIVCNYDGAAKHHTEIGKRAFIGSNSALVAPLTIGDGAYIGSGSVITRNVPADALALGRGQQVVKEGWARRLRARLHAKLREPAGN